MIVMPKTPRTSETLAQTIKRLELRAERLRNLLLNEIVDILDSKYEASLRKSIKPRSATPSICPKNKPQQSLRLLGIT